MGALAIRPAGCAVGTIDQVLLAAPESRATCWYHYAAARQIVVIDGCTPPMKYMERLEAASRGSCRIPVVRCHRRDLPPARRSRSPRRYRRGRGSSGVGGRVGRQFRPCPLPGVRVHEIQGRQRSPSEIIRPLGSPQESRALDLARRRWIAVVIRNLRSAKAQETYEAVASQCSGRAGNASALAFPGRQAVLPPGFREG